MRKTQISPPICQVRTKGIKLADEHFKGTLQSYVKIVLRNEFLEVRATVTIGCDA